jgi:hypothetical protein
MYNLNYAPTALGVQSWTEILSGGTRTKKGEYHWSSEQVKNMWSCISIPPYVFLVYCLYKA